MISNSLVRGFIKQGFAAFETFANKTVDGELLGKIKIVKTYGHLLLSHIPKIKSKCVKDSYMAGAFALFWLIFIVLAWLLVNKKLVPVTVYA